MKTWTTSDGTKIFKVLGGRSNVFLISRNNRNILVDTSPAFMRGKLNARLKKLNVSKIDLLILTHAHFDHAENACWIKNKFKARVGIHKSETSYLAHGETDLPGGTNPFSGFLIRFISRFIKSPGRYQPCESDLLFDEYFKLEEFGLNVYVVHTPGHTEGSVSVIVDNEIALVGDSMFGVFRGSVFPPFACDVKKMVESWGKLLETSCCLFIPSHGSANSRDLLDREYRRKSLQFTTRIT